jgi:hypothetical protein
MHLKPLPAQLESETSIICLCDFYSRHSAHLNC